ncbi:exonuclease SbcCD subunit D C-terminal domain-containing protein [Anaeromyxobacter sp. PSR-1]|uniref:exonuclease SbcCD subunit D C-terminal domain-containing protein n=1 Tax=Anaeromyxobacter sp. PSR-1 TaxID=1300915 RepID=UPI0005E15A70|nr:exonuclease SbcCD subunit D C-terminal domain-containing protein [Anaeromyxobacter sp. PSR-1]GAO05421.1 nuclease SbcCD subunit D [Anaeromyxobacter sp. PSR-1]
MASVALRILHTADWHLGHALHGVDRGPEHERFVAWLLDTAQAEAVDAVVVAGDVFDAANPPAGAQALWYRFLAEAWRRLPRLQLVVVGGNHDSASRLDAVDPLLREMGRLHVVGGVPRGGAGAPELERLLVPLEDASGRRAAWVAAVPYLRAADLGAGAADADAAEATRRFYAAALEGARARRAPGEALLATGHLYAVGGKTSDLSERRLAVGNQAAVPADAFPADLAYVALGHLHLAQAVGGRETVRYSGSVLPLSFGERGYRHGVVVADLEGEAVRAQRVLRVPRFVELVSVPDAEAPAPLPEVLAALEALPARGDGPDALRPLLEVKVRLERPEPALRALLDQALAGKEARLVRIATTLAGTGRALGDGERRALGELVPEEVFRRKYDADYGGPPPDALLEAFRALLQEVESEEGAR